MILVSNVLKSISDSCSLELFRTVALTKPDVDILISKTKLTRKQYYSRMSRLMNAGLIKRKNGKHTLTAFGKIIYHTALTTIENATTNYWKLKAIDSLEMSNDLPVEEHKKIIASLIDSQQIKSILISDISKFESTRPYAAELLHKQMPQIKQELLAHQKR
jgi:predicted transcriptional regulator